MKLGSKLFAARAGAVLAICGAIFSGSGFCADTQTDSSRMERTARASMGLAGTWRVTVSLQDCQTHTPLGHPFHALLTFASGGTLGGATTNPAFLPGQRSPDFGTWRRTGWSTYTAVDEAFILFDGGPFTAGVQTLAHKITLSQDGNEFTDDATTQFADFNDVAVSPPSGCAAAVGKRVE